MTTRPEPGALLPLAAALGAATLIGPLLQKISYGGHAHQGMWVAAGLAAILAHGASRIPRPSVASLLVLALFVVGVLTFTVLTYDAEGSYRMRHSIAIAMCVGLALATLTAATSGPRPQGATVATTGVWLLILAAGAVPAAVQVEGRWVSLYSVTAGGCLFVGGVMTLVGLRRRHERTLMATAAALFLVHLVALGIYVASSR